jgi:ABC-type phosphate/phosphonate transport system substrate-binding protein
MLIAKYRPDLTESIRVIESTALASMPAFVAAPSLPADAVARLRAAFAAAATRPWFAPFGAALLIRGFAAVDHASYAATLAWDREAKEAGYVNPA